MYHFLTDYPDLLEVSHIQQILRIGRRQAYELIRSAPFPIVRDGKRIIIAKEVLINWLTGTVEK
ncbi:helix-turn-helix domain-containing protein [Radiobacillus deserti]|uniref:Helix-turn-helix domain-containing protein n=1 Tax=Radiobacillus deserti TaxID=2594883 RepID=A0A516KDI0_9BACI|nr:helix-turn-helix domain-containing protein [Radiobacillus deserti]QDP39366.1 helix-turn-helix domain-containing protein [Radiobacillus deserti]